MNLFEGLQEELNRNRELLSAYKAIPQGAFGAAFIERDIKLAETAMAEMDTIAMLKCYKALKENQ